MYKVLMQYLQVNIIIENAYDGTMLDSNSFI